MMSSESSEGTIRLIGRVVRILFEGDDGSFAVARFEDEESDRELTIVGNLGGVIPGEKLRLQGRWVSHPRFGRQVRVFEIHPLAPATTEGLKKYLASGAIEGVGDVIAQRLVDVFGDELQTVLDEDPDRLHEVEGVGASRIEKIIHSWTEKRFSRDALIFLQSHGLGPGLAGRVFAAYGLRTIAEVQENPYGLIRRVQGIGFQFADRVGRSLGIDPQSEARIDAGLDHTLDIATQEGHVCLPHEELVQRATRILGASETLVQERLQAQIDASTLVEERSPSGPVVVYLPRFHEAELALTERILTLRDETPKLRFYKPEEAVANAELETGLTYAPGQRDALIQALTSKVAVLTGGPGVGKTTIIRALVRILQRKDAKIALAAPTGRAAKRLAHATGVNASTIHRLLRFDPTTASFAYGEDKRLKAEFVIVDEVSMTDLPLARALFEAVEDSSNVLLVGDADQLPSVGPGNVLRDIIDSGVISVSRLKAIYRQSQGNPIVEAAHEILQGRIPDFRVEGDEGISFIEEEDPERIPGRVVRMVSHLLPERLQCGTEEIQVLSPMIKAPAGTNALNTLLQAELNPLKEGESPPPEKKNRTLPVRTGDRVLQIRNNYELNVFNGDLGVITFAAEDSEGREVSVQFEDKPVTYKEGHVDQLLLAYAITIHRSQGSEFPVVVIPLTTQHRLLLRRSLLYTAVTRARKLVVLVGTRRALRIAIDDNRETVRHTGLRWRLSRLGAAEDAPEEPLLEFEENPGENA